MAKEQEDKKLLKCPFGKPHWCNEECALFDLDDDCCCIRVLTRAIEDLASEYYNDRRGLLQ